MPQERAVATKAVILLLITVCPALSQAQGGRSAGATNSNSQDAALSKPVDWGTFQARIFKSVDKILKFTLQTSWIPGENRKGMFRYKMSVFPSTLDSDSAEEIETLINRVSGCLITLNLYDVDGFLLRALSVPFSFGVDEKARKRSLFANTASQMDAKEYRQLVGSGNESGSWSVSWDCGPSQ